MKQGSDRNVGLDTLISTRLARFFGAYVDRWAWSADSPLAWRVPALAGAPLACLPACSIMNGVASGGAFPAREKRDAFCVRGQQQGTWAVVYITCG